MDCEHEKWHKADIISCRYPNTAGRVKTYRSLSLLAEFVWNSLAGLLSLLKKCCGLVDLYGDAFAERLMHLSDAVLVLEAVKDDSEILGVIPDPARSAFLHSANC